MSATVYVSLKAQQDIDDIVSHLQFEAGHGVAVVHLKKFNDAIVGLTDFPEIGAPRPRLGQGIRILVLTPYLVIYRVTNEEVVVRRVLDGRRRITRKLINAP